MGKAGLGDGDGGLGGSSRTALLGSKPATTLLHIVSGSRYIRALVSKKRRRLVVEGYDLDLSYINDRLLAMSFPAQNMQAFIRNPMWQVQRALDLRHGSHYKVHISPSLRLLQRISAQSASKIVAPSPMLDCRNLWTVIASALPSVIHHSAYCRICIFYHHATCHCIYTSRECCPYTVLSVSSWMLLSNPDSL